MRLSATILLLSACLCVYGQQTHNYLSGKSDNPKRTLTWTDLGGNYQWIIGYTETGYWSKRQTYQALAQKEGKWESIEITKAIDRRGRIKIKRLVGRVDQDSVKSLVTQFVSSGFWQLSQDSLNKRSVPMNDSIVKFYSITDGVTLRFETFLNGDVKVIEAHEPYQYLKLIPNSPERKTFIRFREQFLSCWRVNRS